MSGDTGKLVNRVNNIANVNDLIQDYGDGNTWCWEKLSSELPVQIAIKLLLMPFNSDMLATPIWKITANGQFSTRSAWELMRRKERVQPILAKCWTSRVPTTIAIFWWKVLQGWLPVDEVLQHRGMVLASKCYCCNKLETIDHVLMENEEVQKVWCWFSNFFQVELRSH